MFNILWGRSPTAKAVSMHYTPTMDIERPDIERKKMRNQILIGIAIALLLVVAGVMLRQLKPADPEVERSTLFTDTVKRGPLLRQVHGIGSLVPREDRLLLIPSQTDGTVVRILVLPGRQGQSRHSHHGARQPVVTQEAQDAVLQLRSAQADYRNTQVKLQSDIMTQKGAAADINAQYSQAQLQAKTDKALYDLGVISGLAYADSKGKADSLTTRNDLEGQKLTINEKALASELAVEQAKVEQARTQAELRPEGPRLAYRPRRNRGRPHRSSPNFGRTSPPGWHPRRRRNHPGKGCSARSAQGVVKDRRNPGARYPDRQPADRHPQRVIPAYVQRIDPAVLNGTVTVDVQLEGTLPAGARPDLSVDGTIDLQRLHDVLMWAGRRFGTKTPPSACSSSIPAASTQRACR